MFRKLHLFILIFCTGINLFAQKTNSIKLSGTLLDETNVPVEYANIVMISSLDSLTFFGGFSDLQGQFIFEVPSGEYILKVSVIGFDNFERKYHLKESTDLGEIILHNASVEISEIVVKRQRIIREADRFIINVSNDPTAIGKSANDLLAYSPGVFVQEHNGSITINGKTGTKVMVNERILHEQGLDLIRYLQTLKAEDIVRIEVLPSTGAEFDADMTGGVIKIKLRRQREDGMNGSIGTQFSLSPAEDDVFSLYPSLTLNYKNNKVSLYTSLNYNLEHTLELAEDSVDYNTADRIIRGNSVSKRSYDTKKVRIGGVYDIDNRQSIGLEFNYSLDNLKNTTHSNSDETDTENLINITSHFRGKNIIDKYSLSANYILELDSLGSIFKILFDYDNNKNKNKQDYNSKYEAIVSYDSIYRSDIKTDNRLYVLSTDLEKKINSSSLLRLGLKYSKSSMDNRIIFDYYNRNVWHNLEQLSSNNTFDENVFAIYGAYTSEFKGININLGLRGEYTYATPWTNKIKIAEKQKYFKLFPTVNILFHLDEQHIHSIIFNYNKKIRRPTFSDLNPYRLPTSEYSFIEGNPYLEPAYSNDYSTSLVLYNKYNFTFGVTSIKNDFSRIASEDTEDNNVMILRQENMANNTNYYININLPIEVCSWWNSNTNLLGSRNIVKVIEEKDKIFVFQGGIENTFILPKKVYFQLEGYYVSPSISGNIKMLSVYKVNSSLRKSFVDNKITVSIFANDIFNSGRVRFKIKEEDFSRYTKSQWGHREFGLSIRYNFKTGKSIKVKNIESGADEERSRL
ncbi:MAG: TonB-dependent receptor [Tannerellaceae bacterium]|jgi:hypothetical protein|nr:TonB-dependent receptor [Tannerellaceae bacterium]